MDVNFLVNRTDDNGMGHYFSYHSVTLPGGGASSKENDTLNLSFFGVTRPEFYYRHGGECRGLLFFDKGRILICNPTTKERKFLPPSQLAIFAGDRDSYFGNGFGYDESSEDFKIIRFFLRYAEDHLDEYNEEYIPGEYIPPRVETEIYSFKTNCWKEIDCPPSLSYFYTTSVAIHINGYLYWASTTDALVSFNLATEVFSLSQLPCGGMLRGYKQDLFELDGKLGAFIYEYPDSEFSRKTDDSIQIWVWNEGSWEMRNCITEFDDVLRPLELKHGLLFLEGKVTDKLSQLRVYDLATKKLELLDVYAYEGRMEIFRYIHSTYPLPKDAQPIPESDDEDIT